jgi:hypothetical protein
VETSNTVFRYIPPHTNIKSAFLHVLDTILHTSLHDPGQILKEDPSLGRQTSQTVSSEDTREQFPLMLPLGLALEEEDFAFTQAPIKPTERMCDVDDYINDYRKSQNQMFAQTVSQPEQGQVICDVDEWFSTHGPSQQTQMQVCLCVCVCVSQTRNLNSSELVITYSHKKNTTSSSCTVSRHMLSLWHTCLTYT